MQSLELLKSPRTLFDVLKETYSEWSEDKASRLAAALAYYTAFSIAPLLLISIAVAGLVFGREAAQGQVSAQIQGAVGQDAAAMIETSLANSQDTGAGTIAAIVGLATLIWSASNVFSQLQDALNTIWEVAPDPNAGLLGTVKRRFLSMTMVLGIGFLLLVSLALSAAISVIGGLFEGLLPGGATVWQLVNFGLSFAVVTLLFAAIYKVLPDVDIAWSDVWIGGAVTALLFSIGKLLIGLYLGYASVGSTFGAAGSLLVFLVWVYYSAQILFFGAEFTQVYARRYGSRIRPSEDAIGVTEEARAEQGMPHRETVEQAATGEGGPGARRGGGCCQWSGERLCEGRSGQRPRARPGPTEHGWQEAPARERRHEGRPGRRQEGDVGGPGGRHHGRWVAGRAPSEHRHLAQRLQGRSAREEVVGQRMTPHPGDPWERGGLHRAGGTNPEAARACPERSEGMAALPGGCQNRLPFWRDEGRRRHGWRLMGCSWCSERRTDCKRPLATPSSHGSDGRTRASGSRSPVSRRDSPSCCPRHTRPSSSAPSPGCSGRRFSRAGASSGSTRFRPASTTS